jgi:prepilin-type N-terminal cleavage/methylation domain-containing protein
MKARNQQRASTGGFTLVEVLAVIAIIVMMIGLVVGISSMAGIKADEAKARANIQEILNGLQGHMLKTGSYPLTVGAQQNMSVAGGFNFSTITNFAPNAKMKDPWGRGYWYQRVGPRSIRVWSWGRDGRNNTADDISSASTN